MRKPKAKVGDEVVVHNYGPMWRGEGVVKEVREDQPSTVYIIHVNGRQGGFYEQDFTLKAIINSPLYKALT